MQLCRCIDNRECAAVWFFYKWELCVSLALQVPNSREFVCLETMAEDEAEVFDLVIQISCVSHTVLRHPQSTHYLYIQELLFSHTPHFLFLVCLKNYFIPIRHLTCVCNALHTIISRCSFERKLYQVAK